MGNWEQRDLRPCAERTCLVSWIMDLLGDASMAVPGMIMDVALGLSLG
jgi:hypothetical protein